MPVDPSRRPNGRKENDWVLYAFIIREKGGELSLNDLSRIISNFKRRDSNPKRIAAIIKCNMSKGFERTAGYSAGIYVSMYSFSGENLDINPSTLSNWEKIIR